MIDIIERLQFDAVRTEAQFSKGVAGNIQDAMAEITKLRAERDAVARDMRERCAKVADEKAQEFRLPEYATNQPFSSMQERFACGEVAKAIRALPDTPAVIATDEKDAT